MQTRLWLLTPSPLMHAAKPPLLCHTLDDLDRWQEIARGAVRKDAVSPEEARALAIRAGAHTDTRWDGARLVWEIEPFEIEKVDGAWVVFFDRAPDL